MKDIKIIAKVDSLGRILIPADIRNQLDIEYYDIIEFYTKGKSIFLKRRYYKMCPKCKNDLVKHDDNFCSKCGQRM